MASKITSTSHEDIRTDNVKSSNTELIARATSEPAMERTESPNGKSKALQNHTQETKVSLMTYDELAKAIKEMRWQLPSSQWTAMDKYYMDKLERSDIVPGKNTRAPLHIQVGSFNQRWALWASEIKDEKIRDHVINVAMEKMEKVWRHAIDAGYYPKHLQQDGAGRKGAKRDKNEAFLNFEDDIETHSVEEVRYGRTIKSYYPVTIDELKATGVNIEKINTRIAARDVADGEVLFEDFKRTLEGRKISLGHWKARTDITGVNIHGRDLYIYALHEVQMAKQEIRNLQSYLPSHKKSNQKRNTIIRIAHQAALLNTWLAIAIELANLRPKHGTDVATPPGLSRQESISAVEKVSKDVYVSPESFATSYEGTSASQEDVLPSNLKVKVPFNFLAHNTYGQEQLKTPLMLKTSGLRRLIVKLRVPTKHPEGTEASRKQNTASKQDRQGARSSQNKRKVVYDSDYFEDEDKMDTKRKKTNDSRKQVAGKDLDKQFPTTPKKQISELPTPTRSSSTSVPAHSIRLFSEEEKERRDIYLRKYFLPTVNKIFISQGINHMRSIPKDWTIVKSKLKAARVPAKHRNNLLKQFKFGFQARPSGHQPSRRGSSAIKAQDDDAMLLASTSGEQGLIVTLHVPSGFNPVSYGTNTTIILPGYRYRFNPQSNLNDRIVFLNIIAQSVQAVLAGKPPNGEWTRAFGQYKPVVNSVGDVIADGFWDEFDGAPAAKGAWLFSNEDGGEEL